MIVTKEDTETLSCNRTDSEAEEAQETQRKHFWIKMKLFYSRHWYYLKAKAVD